MNLQTKIGKVKSRIFTQPLQVPKPGEKVYALSGSDVAEILRIRGLKTELDPGMGGVSPRHLDDILKQNSELVSVDLALTAGCNFKCVWCYRPGDEWGKIKLNFEKIASTIEEAANLGVKFFVLTGGEPLVYKDGDKDYFDVISKINEVYSGGNLSAPKILTFSDVALIDEYKAERLAGYKIGLCLKRDSLNHEIQDGILDAKNGSKKMERGYENLFKVGYGSNPELPVSVNTVLAKAIKISNGKIINTLDTAIDLHMWIRSHGMEHSIVPIHFCGEAKDDDQETGINPIEVKSLYDILAEIDVRFYNDNWRVFSAFTKNRTCNRPGRGLHIRATGKVTGCSESPLVDEYVFGNIKEQNLTGIVRSSKFQEFKEEFSHREGEYICNPDVCDLNANNLCRGGCAVRSAYSMLDVTTGMLQPNPNPLAYSQGREDALCPGWIVLAQKQGILIDGIYEQIVDKLLSKSSLDSQMADQIRKKIVEDFNILKGEHRK